MDNSNNKLKLIAEKILKRANIPDDQKFGSVIAVLMVVSMILTFIRILQECNKKKTDNMTAEDKTQVYAENIREFSKKRGWFTRMRMRRIVKKELSPEDYNKYGIKLVESILDTGEIITDEEAYTLVEAANV
jgi:hypothetical protein